MLADWTFTTPSSVPADQRRGDGHMAGIPLTTPWRCCSVWVCICSPAVVGCRWYSLWSTHAKTWPRRRSPSGTPLPAAYWQLARFWFWLGVPAFTAHGAGRGVDGVQTHPLGAQHEKPAANGAGLGLGTTSGRAQGACNSRLTWISATSTSFPAR
ncbi:MAG: DUF2269 family protein [Rhodocyclaceae bacterium]|nr:DUF2269 family protein [Rhodocyclaceae bacterium]